MNRRRLLHVAQWLAAPVFCLLLAGIVIRNLDTASPGALVAAHAQVPELRGAAGCNRCHTIDSTPLQESCSACHEDIAAQLTAGKGIHGRLQKAIAADCGRCHKEHRGQGFLPVGERAFRLAGLDGGQRGFTHQGLDFQLTGKHDQLACSKCHEHAEVRVLTKGAKRFLGLDQACASCHEDPHEGALPGCAECHGQALPFGQVARFEHDARFALTGSHGGLLCKQCHEARSPASVEALFAARGEPQRELQIRGCDVCHAPHHAPGFITAVAQSQAVQPPATCGLCHSPQDEDFHVVDTDQGRRLHAGTGFALTAPHDRAECKDCHSGIGTPLRTDRSGDRSAGDPGAGGAGAVARAFTERFPGRAADACAACHQDPHQGDFVAKAYATVNCGTCHGGHGFQPARFTLAMHDRTRFPLTGSHQAVGCRECHALAKGVDAQQATGADRVFAGTPRACGDCHDDVHDGAFDRAAGQTRSPKGAADAATGCARCHDTGSFQGEVTRRRFDHGRWTGFALTGGHAAVSCEKCHQPATQTVAGLRTLGKVASTRCADCHQDPHAGQFRVRGQTDCAQCHTTQPGFQAARFDHQRHSRFRLDEHHVQLDCGKCHRSYPTPGGAAVVRYKPLGTRCADCHGWQSMADYRRDQKRRTPRQEGRR